MERSALNMEKMVPVLKLFGDHVRLSILWMLHDHQCCVCELVEALKMSQPSVSQHLRKLRDAQIVKENRRGKWIYYSLNKETDVYPLVKSILTFVPEQKELTEDMDTARNNRLC